MTEIDERTARMDPVIRELWAAALESGAYEQGKMVLASQGAGEDKPRYCCLGVLCEVLRDSRNGPDIQRQRVPADELSGAAYAYNNDTIVLPPAVVAHCGLAWTNPLLRLSEEAAALVLALSNDERRDSLRSAYRSRGTVSLASLNDAGIPFPVIAQLIRRYL